MRCLKLFTMLALLHLLTACATAPVSIPYPPLLHDEHFADAHILIDASAVFRVSPEMKEYLKGEVAGQLKKYGHAQGLFNALYSKNQLKLEYDSARTRTATEAFADRTGNCLSLAIMTAAFADELEMASHFHAVPTEDNWLRYDDLYVTSTHVNLTVGHSRTTLHTGFDRGAQLTIDFTPLARDATEKATTISRKRMLAMYMNNRAVETLVQRRPQEAYWWAREAILHDPTYASAFNTLSIIYGRSGLTQYSEQSLKQALAIEPDNIHALSNLKDVLGELNRVAERDAVSQKLKTLVQYEPYYFFDLGQTAFHQKDFARAKELFSREITRQPYNHEFHFWLARTFAELGDRNNALRHLSIALDTSTTLREQGLYSAKLAKLKGAHISTN
jgi:Tfp pilus assembly protein PilF